MKLLTILFIIILTSSCQSKEEKIQEMNQQIDALKTKERQLEFDLKFEEEFLEKTNVGGNRQSIINIETEIFYINKSIDSINSEIINLK